MKPLCRHYMGLYNACSSSHTASQLSCVGPSELWIQVSFAACLYMSAILQLSSWFLTEQPASESAQRQGATRRNSAAWRQRSTVYRTVCRFGVGCGGWIKTPAAWGG
eukprot:2726222-Pleurochrysis_carterae.AAC.1